MTAGGCRVDGAGPDGVGGPETRPDLFEPKATLGVADHRRYSEAKRQLWNIKTRLVQGPNTPGHFYETERWGRP